MKFKTKTAQKYHRGSDDAVVFAKIVYRDNGDHFMVDGYYYVDGSDWREPISRTFSREDAEALQSAVGVTNGDTPLESWDKIKIACSIYELNASSGFGEWEVVI